ncbi:hypothetical protein ELD05_03175 [Caldicellulosiruptor changbaiensis]|uniref:Uncharacterized protein n=2 Tax=Caldicellulosiruptor changbaiensis TaxID=1222016 RepID=A0A3T0D393_9FIRM|nr:hypothetical protein ELD05_03175 [Caldicellulosiruptor changbaiensis]
MRRSSIFLIIFVFILVCLLNMTVLVFANSNSIINHNEEVMKLRRQLAAEHHLNALLELLNRDSSFKMKLDELTGNKGSYDFKKFKLSDEYELYKLFVFPLESKLASNGHTKILYLKEGFKNKIENLKLETFEDALNTEFVHNMWARIIFYDGKPVGYMLIDWDKNYNDYIISESTMGYSGLGEAIIFMKEFLRSKGQHPNVKIVDALERSLYVVSEDGNWWCTDAADSSNPQMYRKQIWSFKEIKEGLNNRPKEILKLLEDMQKDPHNVLLGGSSYKPLYETAIEIKKMKNILIAILMLFITVVFIVVVNLTSKIQKRNI